MQQINQYRRNLWGCSITSLVQNCEQRNTWHLKANVLTGCLIAFSNIIPVNVNPCVVTLYSTVDFLWNFFVRTQWNVCPDEGVNICLFWKMPLESSWPCFRSRHIRGNTRLEEFVILMSHRLKFMLKDGYPWFGLSVRWPIFPTSGQCEEAILPNTCQCMETDCRF